MKTDRWAEARKEQDNLKASLEEEFEMAEVSEDKRNKLFELAWSFGHSSGEAVR